MRDRPKKTLSIREWPGLFTNVDLFDVPSGGAVTQHNLQSLKPGLLSVRRGVQKSSAFTTSGGSHIISQFTYQSPTGDWIITADAAGTIKARKNGSALTLSSGNVANAKWSFIKARNGDLIGVNGANRGIRWDSLTSTAEQLGITGPTVAPTVTEDTGGGALTEDGVYYCGYRFLDNTLPTPTYSSLSPAGTVTINTATSRIDWSDIPSTAEARVTRVQLWRTAADAPNVFYFITEFALGTTTYADDDDSDNTLIAAAASDPTKRLVVELPNGELSARRFTPPPQHKIAVSQFQDRAFYAGDFLASPGTLATTSGNPGVTGTGTAFSTDMAGRYLWISGESAPIEIDSVSGATSLTLASNASQTASGLAYNLNPAHTDRSAVYFSAADEPESVTVTSTITLQENTGDDDEIVGLMAFGSLLYVLKERHVYSMSFMRQPIIDADVRLLAARGAINNDCWVIHEGSAYLMDQNGCYKMSLGGQIEPLSGVIQTYFRRGQSPLDWTKKQWFHVAVDPQADLVYFFVAFTADNSTRPRRALVLNSRTGAWWVESYAEEIGAASLVAVNGEMRLALGGQSDRIYLAGEGYTDYVSAQIRGAVVSATSGTLTAASNAFPQSIPGAPLAIVAGTGKGQIRTVSSNTTDTLTLSANWTTTPDTTSTFLVGAIEHTWKSGVLEYLPLDMQNVRKLEIVSATTATAATFDARLYQDRSSTPLNCGVATNIASVSTQAAEPDAVCDMTKTDGVHEIPFHGLIEPYGESPAHLQVEVRGFQGDDAIEFSQITVEGVE